MGAVNRLFQLLVRKAPCRGVSLSCMALLAACDGPGIRVEQPAWALDPGTLTFDHHLHTTFSDGSRKLEELAAIASEAACDAVVFSDHSDTLTGGMESYFEALDRARLAQPGMLLFAGLEMEMPSYEGREHVGVVASPRLERRVLPEIARLAHKDLRQSPATPDYGADRAALAVASAAAREEPALQLIYNHPSRRDASAQENLRDFLAWREMAPMLATFAGAPGHQNAKEPGGYSAPLLTMDRWDPAVAEIGGSLDQLLSAGHQVWGAIAASDYHNDRLDHRPCSFSRTHLAVPDRSYEGVLQALEGGTFWSDHGEILDEFNVRVEFGPDDPMAAPGGTVLIGHGDAIPLMHIEITRGKGALGRPLTAEIIGNCQSGNTELMGAMELSSAESIASTFLPVAETGTDGESCFVRVRLRMGSADSSLLAYSNHVRFYL